MFTSKSKSSCADASEQQSKRQGPNCAEHVLGLAVLLGGAALGTSYFFSSPENKNLLQGEKIRFTKDPVRIDITEVRLEGDILVFTSVGQDVYKLPFHSVSTSPICKDEKPWFAVADKYECYSPSELTRMRDRNLMNESWPGSTVRPVGDAYFAGLPQETIRAFWEAIKSGNKDIKIVYRKD